ncbi:hypothetical protein IWX90DRAFT_436700 [Phyllosticta citrichinensis]|uniref:Uncharacterized protein n=1 Tax=Phyllosticta citrichinensis TaxID=1130410 RepID=A0ABR1XS43_9PEZI
MTSSQADELPNIRQYASDAHRSLQHAVEPRQSDLEAFEARLDQTVQELRERVQDQERALQELRQSRASNAHFRSGDPKTQLQQLRVLKDAYDSLTSLEPDLPSPSSVLPPLLAVRITQQGIKDTKDAIQDSRDQLASTQRQLECEESNLRDANAIAKSLESRIDHLQIEDTQTSTWSPSQVAQDMLNAVHKRKEAYGSETDRLRTALESFTNGLLAPLIAAEELGGPIVGDLLSVDDEMLAAGFSHQGKPKPLKQGQGVEDKRQRRLEDIWGMGTGTDSTTLSSTEREAAAREIQSLLQSLYDARIGQTSGGEYVVLERDSAAARFLVRAKVAQLHPKDARRMRLVDFGRDLE